MKSSADRQGIELSFAAELSDKEAFVIMDETKLIQILSNLVSNAIKFTHKGSVNFGYLVGQKLLFYVKDTGVGIPEQMYNVIFERFRQLDYSNEKIYGGSGLGLSIAKAYVELMNGKIWVESELGKGSVFYVEFPLHAAAPVNPVRPDYQLPKLENSQIDCKVLIAEDEDFNFFLLREVFDEYNIPYIRAIDGVEAISLATNESVKLVLMDLKMPRLDGYVATKTIKSNKPELPIIALTSYVGDRQRQRAFEAGCVDFIEKPVSKEALLATIARYLLPV
jgi:CheY-like chemotaxis protein